ncbi:MAG: baseplate J/gp47 family protein [Proteobacteria bacterium]|nr:baseplate J/gp47 family protein [Pseudomonadota bacterium]
MTIAELRSLFERAARALMPTADTTPQSPLGQLGAVLAALVAGAHHRLDILRRDSVPSTATYQGALVWAQALNVEPAGPTVARGKAALQVQGTPFTAIASGLKLVAETNQVNLVIDGTYQVGANGMVVCDVRTIDRGTIANLPVDTVCRFVSTPPSLQETAKIIAPLSGGLDTEPQGSFQARVAQFFSNPPQGGSTADYARWISEALPDRLIVGYPLPRRAGKGSVDLVGLAMAERSLRLLSAADQEAIAAYVADKKPATDVTRTVTAEPVSVDIELAVTPVSAPQYQSDFDDAGGLTVQSWQPDTRHLQFTGPLPADMQPNHRLSLAVTVGESTGREQRIAARISADTIELVNDPNNPVPTGLAAGDRAYAGGPLVEPARQAILNGYSLASDHGTVAIPGVNQLGPANPGTRYGSWLDRIEPSRLAAAARAQPGVDDATVVAPSATILPTDPAATGTLPPDETETTQVLLAGQVIVRYA